MTLVLELVALAWLFAHVMGAIKVADAETFFTDLVVIALYTLCFALILRDVIAQW